MLTAEPTGDGSAAFFAHAADAEGRAEDALNEMRLYKGDIFFKSVRKAPEYRGKMQDLNFTLAFLQLRL